MSDLIGKGAEANIYLSEDLVRKVRVPKSYRIPVIDSDIRKRRTRTEAKILQKISSIGPDFLSSNNLDVIEMEFIRGDLLKDVLNSDVSLAKSIGIKVGLLHDLNIIHGDLTTSNMILSKGNDLRLIDFGLSFFSDKVEDKAVDLHLFRTTTKSKHFAFEEDIWNLFVEGYNPKNKVDVLNRLSVVEARGRNKQKY